MCWANVLLGWLHNLSVDKSYNAICNSYLRNSRNNKTLLSVRKPAYPSSKSIKYVALPSIHTIMSFVDRKPIILDKNQSIIWYFNLYAKSGNHVNMAKIV